jgi:hypothetical protein
MLPGDKRNPDPAGLCLLQGLFRNEPADRIPHRHGARSKAGCKIAKSQSLARRKLTGHDGELQLVIDNLVLPAELDAPEQGAGRRSRATLTHAGRNNGA